MTVARAHRLLRLCGLGIHHYHLVRIIDRETRQHGRFTETRQLARARRLHSAGTPLRLIARTLRIPRTTLRRALRRGAA